MKLLNLTILKAFQNSDEYFETLSDKDNSRAPSNDKIMTLEEVAEYLRFPPQTTWAQEKKIPAVKLGKEWRFRQSHIDKWFNDHLDEKFRDYQDKELSNHNLK